jgi:hypothetical protein
LVGLNMEVLRAVTFLAETSIVLYIPIIIRLLLPLFCVYIQIMYSMCAH